MPELPPQCSRLGSAYHHCGERLKIVPKASTKSRQLGLALQRRSKSLILCYRYPCCACSRSLDSEMSFIAYKSRFKKHKQRAYLEALRDVEWEGGSGNQKVLKAKVQQAKIGMALQATAQKKRTESESPNKPTKKVAPEDELQ